MVDEDQVLEANSASFRSIVLVHLKGLPREEWARLRNFARDETRRSCEVNSATLIDSPENLVAAALSRDAISVNEILTPKFHAHANEIGTIAGMPVVYVKGEGIYFWGPDRITRATLNLWVTHPAYPPGW